MDCTVQAALTEREIQGTMCCWPGTAGRTELENYGENSKDFTVETCGCHAELNL